MKTIKEIIAKHIYDFTVSPKDYESIAREICEVLEDVFEEVEWWDQPDTVKYFYDEWGKFKQANGVED